MATHSSFEVSANLVDVLGNRVYPAIVGVADGRIATIQPTHDKPATFLLPGFIDAHADLGVGAVPQGGDVGPTHWNPQVRAWFSTTANLKDDSTRRSALRSLGFGTALVVPKQGIFRGEASVVNLGDIGIRERVLRPDIVQSIGFQRSFQLGAGYPNSPMGVIALMEQSFMDADW